MRGWGEMLPETVAAEPRERKQAAAFGQKKGFRHAGIPFGRYASRYSLASAAGAASAAAGAAWSTHSMKAIGAESLWRGPVLMIRV